MCDPTTSFANGNTVTWDGPRYSGGSSGGDSGFDIGAIGNIAGQGINAAGAAVGKYYEEEGKIAAFNAAARISDINARTSELTAQSALRSGQQQEQAVRMRTSFLKSQQKTGFAAAGVSLDSDTVARVKASTDIMGEIDASTVAANAARQAWGYRTQGVNYTNQAIMSRAQASTVDPFQAASSSLLTNATYVSSSYYKYKQAGALPSDDWWSRQLSVE